jgi:hypothetical protein
LQVVKADAAVRKQAQNASNKDPLKERKNSPTEERL